MHEFNFRPLKNPELLYKADLIRHKPRGTQYLVVGKCKIKTSGNGWVEGIAYQECGLVDSIIYVRPATMFDEDWELFC